MENSILCPTASVIVSGIFAHRNKCLQPETYGLTNPDVHTRKKHVLVGLVVDTENLVSDCCCYNTAAENTRIKSLTEGRAWCPCAPTKSRARQARGWCRSRPWSGPEESALRHLGAASCRKKPGRETTEQTFDTSSSCSCSCGHSGNSKAADRPL